jgi:hypothetical protein
MASASTVAAPATLSGRATTAAASPAAAPATVRVKASASAVCASATRDGAARTVRARRCVPGTAQAMGPAIAASAHVIRSTWGMTVRASPGPARTTAQATARASAGNACAILAGKGRTAHASRKTAQAIVRGTAPASAACAIATRGGSKPTARCRRNPPCACSWRPMACSTRRRRWDQQPT